ncbi:MAG: DUF5312 family protein [Treponema sp.]|jgi:hypothetical protein|nr:DUF5312 family protein [Treponema sp.]
MANAFLDKLFSLFGGGNDPEAGKKRQIKQLVKNLSGNKYSRFYRPKTEEIDGSLGKFFFDVYKVISSAQVFMQNAAKSAQLKQFTAEAFLDKNLLEVRSRLSPESIEERAKTADVKALAKSIKDDLNTLSAAFDTNRIGTIDRCYNLILALSQFVAFDFFFLLKKFDANITERNFTYQPRFAAIRGEYLLDEIKDFIDVSFAVDPDQDWKNALRALKSYKGMDVVVYEQWIKLLNLLRDVRKSGIMELMIRHIQKDPFWVSKPKLNDEHIAEWYLDERRTGARAAMDKILNAKKNAQIAALAKTIFGTTEIEKTKFYTEKAGEIYTKKNFDGFVFAAAINYLKAFLLDHFKKDIRELCDLLIIRGQWTVPALYQQMSENFHQLMGLSDTLIAFDETLSDTGENGARLKTCIVKADRDKSQARYVTLILKNVNEEALGLINQAAQYLIVVGKSLKNLLDDYQKPKHELVMNWKELEGVTEVPIDQRIAGAYKKIYYLIQMMQFFAKPAEE